MNIVGDVPMVQPSLHVRYGTGTRGRFRPSRNLTDVWGDTGNWPAGNWLAGKGPFLTPLEPDRHRRRQAHCRRSQRSQGRDGP